MVATTYQAISGAGKTFADWPEMVGNIIPYIGGEEEKSEKEPLRLWGKVEDGVIVPAQSPVITCQCIRVPVLNGHTAAVFVKFKKKPTKEELIDRLVHFPVSRRDWSFPARPSSSFSIWRRITALRLRWMSTMKRHGNFGRPSERGYGLRLEVRRLIPQYSPRSSGRRSALRRAAQSTGIYHKEIKERHTAGNDGR